MSKNKLTDAVTKAVPVKIVNESMPSKPRGIDKWEAQDALRALQRAEEIKSNKPLMKAAHKEAQEQRKQLDRVCKPSSGRRK